VTGENRVAMQCMVRDVANEKKRRECESEQHAGAMRISIALFDEPQSTRAQTFRKSSEAAGSLEPESHDFR
jgi:hypothetical protein